jgi:hypothetical protein
MLGQFSSELLTLYPGEHSRRGESDFESAKRRELMSRIATNNWDAVIVTHSGFERLPLSARAQKGFLDGQLAELEASAFASTRRARVRCGHRIVKELERFEKRLEAPDQVDSAAEHRKDDTLTFEELGVDRLFVDEAQAFKNLFYVTKMTRVAGLPQTASERAFDMFLKVQHVQRQNGGGGVVFATGTPVTNTMAEMFTMQRYLQMDVSAAPEIAALRLVGRHVRRNRDGDGTRPRWRGLPAQHAVRAFRERAGADADVPADGGHSDGGHAQAARAGIEGGKPRIVRAPATPELKAFVASLAVRAEKLKTNQGRSALGGQHAQDHRRGPESGARHPVGAGGRPDNAEGKVNQAVREIFAIWQETRASG